MGYQEGQWHAKAWYSQVGMPRAIADWVLEPKSLTQRLRACAQQSFNVNVRRQMIAKGRPAEVRALALKPDAYVRIREVELWVDGEPRVFARTILPLQTCQGEGKALLRLGNRPLGELLFNDSRTYRGPIQWTQLYPHHRLFQQAVCCLSVAPAQLWARRSVFYFVGKPLLVTEVFLF